MRTAFINQLIQEARNNPSIFLIVGDLGFSVVEPFAEEFPDRFLNAGVAEQNMTGIAAGLAIEGYTVFTYSIGNFPTLRCMEQIRYDVCYHNLNVKIVAVGGGYAYGPLGASHHATEELGMLRTIPNLIVCAPGDPIETRAVTSAIIKHTGPCYLRLGKAGEPIVHQNELEIGIGKMLPVIEGKETAILSTGAMLKYTYDYIEDNKLKWGLYSFPFIKPLDLEGLKIIAENYRKIITIEEHQKSSGFGSAILEGYNDLEESKKISKRPEIKRIAIPDQFVSVAGKQEYLRKLYKIKL
ncbi:transketolase family protein [Stygiobacter electus]|uniref:Transketolase C-terminal domain-containing protein n=1 Tax=Stygiobacter electus TaxID=3032292 RepID=A0AAE3TD56_9BACT|nr:transketolase C-terminal domain-containing protein [Stygiobacter electus]MDF1613093.1 transketolase C-terminal domain-containing protein [Stygiobacter electus]